MTVIINLVGGPCCGKSTTASGLFSAMKLQTTATVELVNEVIKNHVYDQNTKVLNDQVLITAEQNHCLVRLKDEVQFVVSDASLLNGVVYNKFYNTEDDVSDYLCARLFNRWDNIVFLLPRKKKYDPYGRSQTEEEAQQIDELFIETLQEFGVEYYDMRDYTHKELPERILEILSNDYCITERPS